MRCHWRARRRDAEDQPLHLRSHGVPDVPAGLDACIPRAKCSRRASIILLSRLYGPTKSPRFCASLGAIMLGLSMHQQRHAQALATMFDKRLLSDVARSTASPSNSPLTKSGVVDSV